MPSYHYRCTVCGADDQRIVRLADANTQRCEAPPAGGPASAQTSDSTTPAAAEVAAVPAPERAVCGGPLERADEVELVAKMGYAWRP